MTIKKKKFKTTVPPLMIIGALIVLFPIFAYMTIDSINRHKEQSYRMLADKSAALIFAIEAGTRSHMMDMSWNENSLKNLLTEIVQLPDIEYIFITDKEGKILFPVKSKNRKHGSDLNLAEVITSENLSWRKTIGIENKIIFEGYKKFSPLKGNNNNKDRFNHMYSRMHMGYSKRFNFKDTMIFVGLDLAVLDETIQNDINHSILMAVILLLIGFTGFILIFLVQRFQATRSSLSKIKVFSDILVQNMPVGLIALDLEKKIVSVNPAAQKVLKLDSKKYKGKHAEEILPKELFSEFQLENGITDLVEKEIVLTFNTEKKTMDILITKLHGSDGISHGTLILLRDLTEVKVLKEKIAKSEKLASIGRLAAGVAHEIRNPLSSLKGFATYFKEVFEEDSGERKIAVTMIEEVDRLNRVVTDLVELARPVNLSGKLVQIENLIDESIKQIEIEAESRNIIVKLEHSLKGLTVFVDQDRIRQVLLNLYLNAMDSMEEGGVISVSTGKIQEKVIIAISDTGKGINDETLTRVFEPYFTTKQSGTGLGLSIVHNIIEAHNGEIKIHSKISAGTIFEIHLPDKGDN